jgi:hypothetical protein
MPRAHSGAPTAPPLKRTLADERNGLRELGARLCGERSQIESRDFVIREE